ncbi:MAG: hypothetical protein ACOY37_09635 [Pseudomonadota bacterium]
MTPSARRARKRADLASVTGAAVAGAAAGAWLAADLRPWAGAIRVPGPGPDAACLAARDRLDRAGGRLPAVWNLLHALCHVAVPGLLVALALRAWSGP